MKRGLIALLAALVGVASIVLAACGGGGSDAPEQDTPRVDCQAKPEQCK
ncbi:hypothetical protein WDZ92_34290 [Nostoc sp. NIES-2111]